MISLIAKRKLPVGVQQSVVHLTRVFAPPGLNEDGGLKFGGFSKTVTTLSSVTTSSNFHGSSTTATIGCSLSTTVQ